MVGDAVLTQICCAERSLGVHENKFGLMSINQNVCIFSQRQLMLIKLLSQNDLFFCSVGDFTFSGMTQT